MKQRDAQNYLAHRLPGVISTDELRRLVVSTNGIDDYVARAALRPVMTENPIKADVALCVGGGNDPLAEYEAARRMCVAYGKTWQTFVCNDTIAIFPDPIDHAVTLHPDKFPGWMRHRLNANLNDPPRKWAHRSYIGFTDWTKDWQGSSGLFMVKIARELGYTHIIGCGIPMTVEGGHITRKMRWNAAHGFQRGWNSRWDTLRPYVRSMSGWTRENLGYPTGGWLKSDIPDAHPVLRGHHGVRA